MLTTRLMKLITGMPKAENHIHIEGSISWELALKLAEKNHVELPCKTPAEIREWVNKTMSEQGLPGFIICDRAINSVCQTEEDYAQVVEWLARDAARQNIIYQEMLLDYPLNEARGVPIEVVMEGYRMGQRIAKEKYGVEVVFIAGIDRTAGSDKSLNFVKQIGNYLDMVDGLGMDCDELGYPAADHKEAYKLGKEMGLFLTAHTGENAGPEEMWSAINELHLQRLDHGIHSIDDPKLLKYLAENEIMCATCPTANVFCNQAEDFEHHPVIQMMRSGVPVSISSDDPPYFIDVCQEYAQAIEKMGFTEKELINTARNAFRYSIKGQKYLGMFDKWIEDFMRENGPDPNEQ